MCVRLWRLSVSVIEFIIDSFFFPVKYNMCDDVRSGYRPVQKKRKKEVWGMKTLKMCFGKERLQKSAANRESVERGKSRYLRVYKNKMI